MSIYNINLPPLAVHFVWHPNDHDSVFDVIREFRRFLTRDVDRPFSREVNIPTFLYSSRKPTEPPKDIPSKLAAQNVVFLFTSKHTLVESQWEDYLNNFPVNDSKYSVVPISVDKYGQNHSLSGSLKNKNFVRAYDWPSDTRIENGILELSHELYRYSFHEMKSEDKGIDSSIKLFLSHAKKGGTGLSHAQAIKHFIDNSNMRRFFDANEISPGFKFDSEIESHIKDSTMVAIVSDAYSSRYWCQREILTAKTEQRPIVVANSLEEYEDRIFPAAGNVPCVHITAESLKPIDILRILIAALLETIRFKYSHALLRYYQKQNWIDSKAIILARPPEIQQVIEFFDKRANSDEHPEDLTICYPEPPLYAEETVWTNYLNVKILTPLWSNTEQERCLYRIGISISEYLEDGYEEQHQHIDELQRLSQTLARHLLARKNTLIYGGDLRDNGFTQFILEEAAVLRDRLQVDELFVENYLAWPLHLNEDSKDFLAKYYKLLKIVKSGLPDDTTELVSNKEIFLPPSCPENKYIWSRCLTKMREDSVDSSDIRIFAGGKLEGYLGKMPGVLEEFIIAFDLQKPIYLVGGLGGLIQKLSNSILNEKVAEEFTEKWQITHNSEYSQLQQFAGEKSHSADYGYIRQVISGMTIKKLSSNTGLSETDYLSLMTTPFVEESVYLILKGLKKLSNDK